MQPLVADFIYLADRLYLEKEALGKKTKTVKALKNELVDLWNAKRFQTDPFYRRLLSYRKGQLGNLSTPDRREKKREGLNILIKQFKTTLHSPEISLNEKFAFLRAIKIIEEEFAQHGDLEKFRVRKAFSSLLENDLIPAVENAKSLSELKELRDLFRSSCEISEKITSKAIESKIEKLSKAFEQKMQNLLAAEPKIARARPMNGEDRATIQRLSQEILDLEPVIGDANAYPFSASKGKPIDDAKTKSGSIALLAAAMRAGANEEDYTDSAENILQLGRDLLRGRSGQCDHMAAAVIAKIVEHIQSGRRWNTTVELIGNEGHAFILINRPQGDISDLNNWKDAIIVDTWLGAIGVHPEYQNRLPTPQNGVISDPEEVKMFAIAFGARLKRMKVHQRLSPQDLRELAQPR